MKPVLIFCGALFLLVFRPLAVAIAQDITDYPYYVVVGAFAVDDNARSFVKQVASAYPDVQSRMNKVRNLRYVFVLSTSDKTLAFAEARKLRQLKDYDDTWVYHGPLDEDISANQMSPADMNPDTGKRLAGVSTGDKIAVETMPVEIAMPDQQEVIEVEAVQDTVAEETVETGLVAGGRKVYFHVYQASNQKEVSGEITVVDTQRNRKLQRLPSNEDVVMAPPGGTGNVLLVSDIFGYRQAQETFNFNNPSDSFERNPDGTVVVPFELVRLQKGDISVMYRVLFFIDAAIMRPESQVEINSLVTMMEENPHYKIRIHGHANGGKSGKIITMGDNNDFFSLTNSREGSGSAKKLSKKRAEVVRDYLIANGISADRTEVKAWGGKLPLYDRRSAQAQENVRVEIEILED